LGSFQQINSEFQYLFQVNNGWSSGDGGGLEEFGKSYGWLFNAKLVSDFEGICIDAVWELPVYQFLNDLSYLKMKREIDNEQQQKIMNKNKLNGR
jgi:hypothetical protein